MTHQQRLVLLLFLFPLLCLSNQTDTHYLCKNDSECLNGGSCVEDNRNGVIYSACDCTPPWGGKYCGTSCALACLHDGICQASLAIDPGASPFVCRCRGNFQGDLCQTPYVTCPDRSQCENGGTCVLVDPPTGTYDCACPDNTSGYSCNVVSTSGILAGVEKDTGLSIGGIIGVVIASFVLVVGTYMCIAYLNRRRGYKLSEDMRRQTNAAFEMDDLSFGPDHEEEIL